MLFFVALSLMLPNTGVVAQEVKQNLAIQDAGHARLLAEHQAEQKAAADKAAAVKTAAANREARRVAAMKAERERVVASRSAARKALVKKNAEKKATSNESTRVVSGGTTCTASFYDEPQMTATGETFNPGALTAASKTLPLNSHIRVSNPKTGASVTVRINDRGPYVGGRCLDLSAAAFSAIGNTDSGTMTVTYSRVG